VASGADGLAGLSAVSGGGGAVAQPAKRPKATNSIEYRFIICRGDRFQKLELKFHPAEILDGVLDRLAGRYKNAIPEQKIAITRVRAANGTADFGHLIGTRRPAMASAAKK
jgi:hypothetical protein